MIPGATAISEAPISSLPDTAYNFANAILRSRFCFEATPIDSYVAFVRSSSSLVWAVEIEMQGVPDVITS